jgi:hypothetical protein
MPRVELGNGGQHISMERYERLEHRAEIDGNIALETQRRHVATPSERVDFRRMMDAIRDAYRRQRGTKHDSAAFDELVKEDECDFRANRWERRHVTNALVRISEKAQFLNKKYYAGRYR